VTEERFQENISRICRGEKEGLKEIYEEYLPFIYHTVFYIVKSKEQAEDLTSDFFMKLWEKASQYKPSHGHKGYLATIARNMAIDFIRKYKKESLYDSIDEVEAYTNFQVEQHSLEDEVLSQLGMEEALRVLNPKEAEVLHLKISGELTFQEIANILEVPMGTITWRYQSAIQKLRRFGYE
jgi:RNA polymerase sigma factor (sigma-70 family)